ncbi:reverse transcriptase domain-containing protein [Tanacetum coccineum]
MSKFPVPGGILTLRSSRIILLECTMVSGPEVRPSDIIQTIAIGSTLTEEGRKALCHLLRRGLDVFSWKPADMTRVSRHIAEHRLNVREGCSRRLVDKAFQKQIGRNLEVYVDDMVIKSRTEHEIIRDMEETFKTLREINMKLNLKKCTFGIEEGMFLGYKVNTEGIMLASLNMFLSKSAENSLPFFKTLKKCTKKSDFQWTVEAETAFKEIKKLIAKLPTLTSPMEKEELVVYLTAAREVVSAVLMTEREEKQMPVYFVSRALQGPEINYTSMEKLVLTLVHASKRLKRYFQAHTIIVITDQPIKQILSRPEILADFIVEHPKDDSLDTPMEMEGELLDPWTLFTDESSCIDGSGAGLILTNPKGAEFTYALRFRFDATNNEAEYEVLIVGIRIAEQMGVKNLQANVDSHLVANQVLVEELKEKYINEAEVLAVVEEEGDTWMTSIYNYLMEETLPAEKEKARVVRRKSESMHAGTQSVVGKAIRTGYYWPTMHTDARKLIRACQDSQKAIQRQPFKDWCEKLCIRQCFAFVKHPQANGLIERANRSLGDGIKARLDERSKDWIEELPHVIWAHRTMIKSSNGDTSFSLTYGGAMRPAMQKRVESLAPSERDHMSPDHLFIGTVYHDLYLGGKALAERENVGFDLAIPLP